MSDDESVEPFIVRRRPRTPLPDVPSDPELLSQVVDEIGRGGPMTFARFMEIALYDRERGYYSTQESRPTREGDFLTAPELHPIFGRAIARHVTSVWRRLGSPTRFTIREYGAGSGALAGALLDGLRRDAPDLARIVRYAPVEHNRHRLEELRSRFDRLGFADRLSRPVGRFVGVVLANEFLDALPVHRVEGGPGGSLLERYVTVVDGRLREITDEPSSPSLAARLEADGVALARGQRGEVRLADEAWVTEVARDLEAGAVTIIDYGSSAAELYSRERQDGTLVGYSAHRIALDPLTAIGRQDLTAHVDLTALARAAAQAGLEVAGEMSQAAFLVGNGLEELVEEIRSAPTTSLAEWSLLRASIGRLLDPRALGGFRVVILTRSLPAATPVAAE